VGAMAARVRTRERRTRRGSTLPMAPPGNPTPAGETVALPKAPPVRVERGAGAARRGERVRTAARRRSDPAEQAHPPRGLRVRDRRPLRAMQSVVARVASRTPSIGADTRGPRSPSSSRSRFDVDGDRRAACPDDRPAAGAPFGGRLREFARPSGYDEGTDASCLYAGSREQDSRSARGGTVHCRLRPAPPRSLLGARRRGHPPPASSR